jgi:hypothetical protein
MNLEADPYRLNRREAWGIAVFPVVLAGIMVLLLTTDVTRGLAMRLSRENSLIEFFTAGLMLIGGAWGIRMAWRVKRGGQFGWWFFLLFSVAMLIVGMEEIAWGQKLFDFAIPAAIEGLNQQHELTLHNMPGIHGHSDMMWSVFALGGLVGIGLGWWRLFKGIAPPAALAPWFLIILCTAVPLIWKDYSGADNRLITLFHRMDEFNEMLIAMASCLYLWLCMRKITDVGVQAEGQL